MKTDDFDYYLPEDLIAQHRGEKIDIGTIPLDDPSTFNIFQDANTTSVFQFESLGMKRMLLQAQPSKFEEIIAFVALYRPGPMDLIPDFIRRMHGEAFKYLHPSLEKIIEPTYGEWYIKNKSCKLHRPVQVIH